MADGGYIKKPELVASDLTLSVNIEGAIDAKKQLTDIVDTMSKLSKNKDYKKYWKSQDELIEDTIELYGKFVKSVDNPKLAKAFTINANALKAMSGEGNLKNLLPDISDINDIAQRAREISKDLIIGFDVSDFKIIFDTFNKLQSSGSGIDKFFDVFSKIEDVNNLKDTIDQLTRDLERTRAELDDLSDVSNIKFNFNNLRNQLRDELDSLLQAYNISSNDWRISDYIESVIDGERTAMEAITDIKRDYPELFEASYNKLKKSSDSIIDTDEFESNISEILSRIQTLSSEISRMNQTILHQEEMILEVFERMSHNPELTSSQQDFYKSLLEDEEAAKSIASIFTGIFEKFNGSSTGEGILFNGRDLSDINDVLGQINESLLSIKSVISDVGEGDSLSPLLNILSQIKEASESISFNMNIDMGDAQEDRDLIEKRLSIALSAYQNLFDELKHKASDSGFVDALFNFDINQYDTTVEKIEAYRSLFSYWNDVIKERDRLWEEDARKYGKNVKYNHSIYDGIDKKYLNKARSAYGSITRERNNINDKNNALENLFGNHTNLTNVEGQLSAISDILGTINEILSSLQSNLKITLSNTSFDQLNQKIDILKENLEEINNDEFSLVRNYQLPDVINNDEINFFGNLKQELIDIVKLLAIKNKLIVEEGKLVSANLPTETTLFHSLLSQIQAISLNLIEARQLKSLEMLDVPLLEDYHEISRLTEEPSGQLSLNIDGVIKESEKLYEEESGQLSLIESITESQENYIDSQIEGQVTLQEYIEKTNGSIEGQIGLFDRDANLEHQYICIKNIVERAYELKKVFGSLSPSQLTHVPNKMISDITNGERTGFFASKDNALEEMKFWVREYISTKNALSEGNNTSESVNTGLIMNEQYLEDTANIVKQIGIWWSEHGYAIDELSKKIKGGLYSAIKEIVGEIPKFKNLFGDLDNLINVDDKVIYQTKNFIKDYFNILGANVYKTMFEGFDVDELVSIIFGRAKISLDKLNLNSQSTESEILSGTTTPLQQEELQVETQTEELISTVDNLGRKIDETFAKKLSGTALVDGLGQIITLIHASKEEFDKFDISKSRAGKMGIGQYFGVSEESSEWRNWAPITTEWYANVRRIFDLDNEKLNSSEIATIIEKYLGNASEEYIREISDKLAKSGGSAYCAIEQIATIQTADGERINNALMNQIWESIGIDGLERGKGKSDHEINIFDPNRIFRIEIPDNIKELDSQIYKIKSAIEFINLELEDTIDYKRLLEETNLINTSEIDAIKKIETAYEKFKTSDDGSSLYTLIDSFNEVFGKLPQLSNATKEVIEELAKKNAIGSREFYQYFIDSMQSELDRKEVLEQELILLEQQRNALGEASIYQKQTIQPTESKISSGTTTPLSQQNTQVEEQIKLQDNLGREIDENNAKLLQGTKLLDEQSRLITLYHFSNDSFAEFDESQVGKNGTAYGSSVYLSEAPTYKWNSLGDILSQWYANVKKIFDYDIGTLSTDEIETLISNFGNQLDEETKNIVRQKMSTIGGAVIGLRKLSGDESEMLESLGYDAVRKQSSKIFQVFNPKNVIKATDIEFTGSQLKELLEIYEKDGIPGVQAFMQEVLKANKAMIETQSNENGVSIPNAPLEQIENELDVVNEKAQRTQDALNSIEQKAGTMRVIHWVQDEGVNPVLNNPNGISTEKYGMIQSFCDELGDAEASSKAILEYWDQLHTHEFGNKGIVIDIPEELARIYDDPTKIPDFIPQEYIKGVIDANEGIVVLNRNEQNLISTQEKLNDVQSQQSNETNISSDDTLLEQAEDRLEEQVEPIVIPIEVNLDEEKVGQVLDKQALIDKILTQFYPLEDEIKEEIRTLINGINDETTEDVSESILNILKKSSLFTDEKYAKFVSYIRKSKIKYDSSYPAEFGDDWKRVNATIGFTSKTGTDVMTILAECNEVLGTSFDLSMSNQDAIRKIYEIISSKNSQLIDENSLLGQIQSVVDSSYISEELAPIKEVEEEFRKKREEEIPKEPKALREAVDEEKNILQELIDKIKEVEEEFRKKREEEIPKEPLALFDAVTEEGKLLQTLIVIIDMVRDKLDFSNLSNNTIHIDIDRNDIQDVERLIGVINNMVTSNFDTLTNFFNAIGSTGKISDNIGDLPNLFLALKDILNDINQTAIDFVDSISSILSHSSELEDLVQILSSSNNNVKNALSQHFNSGNNSPGIPQTSARQLLTDEAIEALKITDGLSVNSPIVIDSDNFKDVNEMKEAIRSVRTELSNIIDDIETSNNGKIERINFGTGFNYESSEILDKNGMITQKVVLAKEVITDAVITYVDELGRKISKKYAWKDVPTIQYDEKGNPLGEVDQNGEPIPVPIPTFLPVHTNVADSTKNDNELEKLQENIKKEKAKYNKKLHSLLSEIQDRSISKPLSDEHIGELVDPNSTLPDTVNYVQNLINELNNADTSNFTDKILEIFSALGSLQDRIKTLRNEDNVSTTLRAQKVDDGYDTYQSKVNGLQSKIEAAGVSSEKLTNIMQGLNEELSKPTGERTSEGLIKINDAFKVATAEFQNLKSIQTAENKTYKDNVSILEKYADTRRKLIKIESEDPESSLVGYLNDKLSEMKSKALDALDVITELGNLDFDSKNDVVALFLGTDEKTSDLKAEIKDKEDKKLSEEALKKRNQALKEQQEEETRIYNESLKTINHYREVKNNLFKNETLDSKSSFTEFLREELENIKEEAEQAFNAIFELETISEDKIFDAGAIYKGVDYKTRKFNAEVEQEAQSKKDKESEKADKDKLKDEKQIYKDNLDIIKEYSKIKSNLEVEESKSPESKYAANLRKQLEELKDTAWEAYNAIFELKSISDDEKADAVRYFIGEDKASRDARSKQEDRIDNENAKAEAKSNDKAEKEKEKADKDKLKEEKNIYDESIKVLEKYRKTKSELAKEEQENPESNIVKQLRKEIVQLSTDAYNAYENISKLSSISDEEKTRATQLYTTTDNESRRDDAKRQDKAIKEAEKLAEDTKNKLQKNIDEYYDYFNEVIAKSNAELNGENKNYLRKEYKEKLEAIVSTANKGFSEQIVSEEDLQKLDRLKSEIETLQLDAKNLNKSVSKTAASKLSLKIQSYLTNNTKLTKENTAELKSMISQLEKMNNTTPVSRIRELATQFNNLQIRVKQAKMEGKSFFDVFKEKIFYRWAAQIGSYFGFNDIIRYGRQAFETIKSLDTALVDLSKTTKMSTSELNDFYYSSSSVAKELGVTTEEIINQASAWSRLGYNTQETSIEMAKLSSQFASISPDMDTSQAQEGLVSIMKAWGIEVNNVEREIMDNINTLGNNFAETNGNIVEGMEKSAAALAATGTSYKEAFALFTGGQEILQDADSMGTALRTKIVRIHRNMYRRTYLIAGNTSIGKILSAILKDLIRSFFITRALHHNTRETIV